MIQLIKLNKNGTKHPLFSEGEVHQSEDGLVIKLKEGDKAGHAVFITIEHLPGIIEKSNDILEINGIKKARPSGETGQVKQ